jgi:hypothetical protein
MMGNLLNYNQSGRILAQKIIVGYNPSTFNPVKYFGLQPFGLELGGILKNQKLLCMEHL